MTIKVLVAGVDMIKFVKPGSQEPYRVMAARAIRGAVKDAGIDYRLIEQAYAAYIYGDTSCGRHALYDVFQTGIPVINVNSVAPPWSPCIAGLKQAILAQAHRTLDTSSVSQYSTKRITFPSRTCQTRQ